MQILGLLYVEPWDVWKDVRPILNMAQCSAWHNLVLAQLEWRPTPNERFYLN